MDNNTSLSPLSIPTSLPKILVTGGIGYIGSHTIVDLMQHGFEVISADNLSRSDEKIIAGIEKITGKKLKNYKIDLCKYDDTNTIFIENPDIVGIIHFAAYKAVGESVKRPLFYYENNLDSLINILHCVQEFGIPNFVFSSSCTVYGQPDVIKVTEETPMKEAASPYGYTKQVGERMCSDVAKTSVAQMALLRYFNPVGAHPSNEIGELPIGVPQNLFPAITQTAIGKLPQMTVYGNTYNTPDGSCVRDYIHVCDIAHAHTLALQFLIQEKNKEDVSIFNLGTGTGVTVLEAIHAFEKVSNQKLNYVIGQKRVGDIEAIYANNDKAKKELNWECQFSLEDMISTAWAWEQKLQTNE
jgi:UDP-glucose 4-epimerase